MSVHNEIDKDYKYSKNQTDLCWYYPHYFTDKNDENFRKSLSESYSTIYGHLLRNAGAKVFHGNTLGIQFRKHYHKYEICPIKPFINYIQDLIEQNSFENAWISSDSLDTKADIIDSLSGSGIKIFCNKIKLLEHDYDRSKSNILDFALELKSFSRCNVYVVNSTRSTICDPQLYQGKTVHYVYDDGWHRSRYDKLFYTQKNGVIYKSCIMNTLFCKVISKIPILRRMLNFDSFIFNNAFFDNLINSYFRKP